MKKGIKRVISVLVLCALVAMLTACGGKEETTTCRLEQEDVIMEIKIDAKGDIITKWTQTSTITNLDEDVKAVLESVVDELKAGYDGYSNVEYTTKFENDSFIEVVAIDMTDKDGVKKLVDEGLLPVEGNASRLSMKQTVENLKSQGYVVVE